jgi:dihydroneopterin aldolase
MMPGSPPPFAGNYECVSLNGVVLQLHIGIRDWERAPDRRQRVQVDVECYRKLRPPPTAIEHCMDYSRLHRYLTSDWPNRPHTDLLETLAHDLVAFVFEDATIESVRVRLAKLDVYLDTAVPAYEITRNR